MSEPLFELCYERSTEQIKRDYPQFPTYEEYDDLFHAIVEVLN